MRLAIDTGGTFTDLVVESDDGSWRLFKSATTPGDPIRGVLDVIHVAAEEFGLDARAFLKGCDMLIHGTTRAINALLTGTAARTAFLTTAGHPDILVLREGGRAKPFDFTIPYPAPLVPRALTFEVPERTGSRGEIVRPLDHDATVELVRRAGAAGAEAVAVCLLWSIVNPVHELRVGELLVEHLPGVPFTLSHQLNPSLREYRRASSSCIDASLKPIMTSYLTNLDESLKAVGFTGRLLVVTSQGGVLDSKAMASSPIHSVNSGPAVTPVAGRHYALAEGKQETAVVTDAGGTTYDVSLVRNGRIPFTRETWIGPRYRGDITGFPSVDVKSVGAGGGSVAWVDEGGLLHVGPSSAGSVPGPACYGRGGEEPTVTDACVVLGYLDPAHFMNGRMQLDVPAAEEALRGRVGAPLGLDTAVAAAAVLELATETMVSAIEGITVNQGIDPRSAVLIGGGGAAGFTSVAIARRLGFRGLVIPAVGAMLSAAGALMSDLTTDYAETHVTETSAFDLKGVSSLLAQLETRCKAFIDSQGTLAMASSIEFLAEGRYPHQVWELEIPIIARAFESVDDVDSLAHAFHRMHEQVFAISDPSSPVEFVTWRAVARCRLHKSANRSLLHSAGQDRQGKRDLYFPATGWTETTVSTLDALEVGAILEGPAVIDLPFTTVIIDPNATAQRLPTGSLWLVVS